MAEMMLCGTCIAPGRFELVAAPVPQSAPDGWVLVDITAAGICGTDYHIYEGKHPYLNYPRVIGHELAGRVAKAAPGWAAGVAVVINPYVSCGACRACLRGKPNCCTRIEVATTIDCSKLAGCDDEVAGQLATLLIQARQRKLAVTLTGIDAPDSAPE